jgi:hypothetical protein
MVELVAQTVYFERPGPANTARTIQLASSRAEELDVRTVLVASTSGATGLLAAQHFRGYDVVVVTHSAGFKSPDRQELTPENRVAIEAAGARILTCQHTFGGVNRAVRMKLNTYQLDEVIAYTLRLFGEGFKVVAEIVVMAADAGLVRTDIPVISIAGTGRGADTAAVLLPTNAQTFFDLKLIEIICRPSSLHPAFT